MSLSQQDKAFSDFDISMMTRALKLAEKGRYSTQPNPRVGCVIVDSQQTIVGEGYHVKAGSPHAEIEALIKAGTVPSNSTAYVTLEPCAHFGRTGPCAQALIDAMLSKVIIAGVDPNPLVSGKGIAMLKAAGIQVDVGLLASEAEALNEFFFFRMRYARPFVSLKLATSIDGKTALKSGKSKWITSSQARKDVQTYRAQACGILSGSGTVIADNPRLNVRVEELPPTIAEQFSKRARQPTRFIVDGKNQLHAEKYQIFNDGEATLVFNLTPNVNINQAQQEQLEIKGNQKQSHVDLKAMLKYIAEAGHNQLWVEAGADLSGALFDAGLVDELILYQAPKLLGPNARGMTHISDCLDLTKAINGEIVENVQIGQDIKTRIRFLSQESSSKQKD